MMTVANALANVASNTHRQARQADLNELLKVAGQALGAFAKALDEGMREDLAMRTVWNVVKAAQKQRIEGATVDGCVAAYIREAAVNLAKSELRKKSNQLDRRARLGRPNASPDGDAPDVPDRGDAAVFGPCDSESALRRLVPRVLEAARACRGPRYQAEFDATWEVLMTASTGQQTLSDLAVAESGAPPGAPAFRRARNALYQRVSRLRGELLDAVVGLVAAGDFKPEDGREAEAALEWWGVRRRAPAASKCQEPSHE